MKCLMIVCCLFVPCGVLVDQRRGVKESLSAQSVRSLDAQDSRCTAPKARDTVLLSMQPASPIEYAYASLPLFAVPPCSVRTCSSVVDGGTSYPARSCSIVVCLGGSANVRARFSNRFVIFPSIVLLAAQRGASLFILGCFKVCGRLFPLFSGSTCHCSRPERVSD
jgi:hypothetical protein